MFKSITVVWTGERSVYRLFDTDFTIDISAQTFDGYATAIASEYSKRHLPLIPNLARYYALNYTDYPIPAFNRDLASDKQRIEALMPDLHYTRDIYPCVINHIKMILWTKGKR